MAFNGRKTMEKIIQSEFSGLPYLEIPTVVAKGACFANN